MKYELKCWKCGETVTEEPGYKCKKCGGIIEVHYDLQPGDEKRTNRKGIFAYENVLPFEKINDSFSLGEGMTPLVRAKKQPFGLENVYYKLEGVSPTSSFKDRGLAVITAKAGEQGLNQIIIASSGNASASAGAYAAHNGQKLVAVVPEATPLNKVVQAQTYGTIIVKVPGGFSNSFALSEEMAASGGWCNATTTFVNPYAREGYKTIGYEIYEQMGMPDWVVIPVGAGPILAAIGQAFEELVQMKAADRVPRLACVQAEHCGPISDAFLRGLDEVQPCENPKPTLASGINDGLVGYTEDGDYTIHSIKKSGGTAVLLKEEEIARSVRMLGAEGVFAEPAGAVGMVALEKLKEGGFVRAQDKVAVVVTGDGLKNPLPIEGEDAPVISTIADMKAYLEGK